MASGEAAERLPDLASDVVAVADGRRGAALAIAPAPEAGERDCTTDAPAGEGAVVALDAQLRGSGAESALALAAPAAAAALPPHSPVPTDDAAAAQDAPFSSSSHSSPLMGACCMRAFASDGVLVWCWPRGRVPQFARRLTASQRAACAPPRERTCRTRPFKQS
jgi:hypothetical protein